MDLRGKYKLKKGQRMVNWLIRDRQKAAGDGQAGVQADARYFQIGNGLNATAHDIIKRCVHII